MERKTAWWKNYREARHLLRAQADGSKAARRGE
jgi:hypothetical protein